MTDALSFVAGPALTIVSFIVGFYLGYQRREDYRRIADRRDAIARINIAELRIKHHRKHKGEE